MSRKCVMAIACLFWVCRLMHDGSSTASRCGKGRPNRALWRRKGPESRSGAGRTPARCGADMPGQCASALGRRSDVVRAAGRSWGTLEEEEGGGVEFGSLARSSPERPSREGEKKVAVAVEDETWFYLYRATQRPRLLRKPPRNTARACFCCGDITTRRMLEE
ncbi:hypothetical protein IF2G_07652 [Cordyceps javanica]|nr:hypothetical protein IF2G_07652 [Cordyceps javanica]